MESIRFIIQFLSGCCLIQYYSNVPVLMLIMFQSIFIGILLLVCFQLENVNARCNASTHEQADLCMQKMFLIGDRSQQFRQTVDEMKTYCRQIIDLQKCVRNFSRKCLPSLGRQVANLLLYGVKKVNRQHCGSVKAMTRFTEIAKCANHGLESKHDCMDLFLAQLEAVDKMEMEKIETRTHLVCCLFVHFRQCIDSTFAGGEQSCPDKAMLDQVMDLIGGYADDAMDLVCGEYSNADSDRCDRLMDQFTDLKTVIDSETQSARSILPYFINIFGSS